MFDEPSSIVAILRHYDSVRIAQGVRGLPFATKNHAPWSKKSSGLTFLDASTHLYKRVCPSVGPLVRLSVGFAFFLKSRKSVNLTNLNLQI